MKYVALLRGINVGGNSLIKMSKLKTVFEDFGLTNVVTYINSGNIIFETKEKNAITLAPKLEQLVAKECNVNSRILLKSAEEIEQINNQVPKEWITGKDIRCYIAFLFAPITPEIAVKEIELREGVDSIKNGPGVLYMTSVMSQLTKSKFNRLASKNIYKDITIRNYNTAKKILALME